MAVYKLTELDINEEFLANIIEILKPLTQQHGRCLRIAVPRCI